MILSIAMIVKNEEKNLDKCLKALKSLKNKLSYEIVIVDTGSEDNTVSIAKKYTKKVYEHKWNNNFAEMRNISINYCEGEWILILDADEVLENPDSIIEFFKKDNNKVCNSATIRFKNIMTENEDKYLIGTLVRLFKRKQEFCYSGIIHEQPKIIAPTLITNITVLHYGYSSTDYNLMEYKYKRNKELLIKDLKDKTELKDKIYTYFQLAQTYAMANRQYEATVSIYEAFNLVKQSKEEKKYLYVYQFLGMNLLSKGNYEKAIEVIKDAVSYSNVHLDFYYILFKSYAALNKYDESIKYYDEYLKLHKKIEDGFIVEEVSVNVNSYCSTQEILKDRIILDFKNNRFKLIEKSFLKLKSDSDKEQLQEIYVFSLMKNNKYDDLIKYLKGKDITDNIIQIVINAFERIDEEYDSLNKNKEKEFYLGIDNRLDIYIRSKYLNSNLSELNIEGVNFSKYYKWKAEIFKYCFIKNKKYIEKLIVCKKEDVREYIKYIITDYICLQSLNEFSKEKFLSTDINEQLMITLIEEAMLLSRSIIDTEYNKIVERAYINKVNLISSIYSREVMKSTYLINTLDQYEYMWIEINKLINFVNSEKVNYIRGLKKLLNEVPEYNKVIKYFLNKVNDNNISEEMVREKERLLLNTEQLIENGNVDEAFNIIIELNSIFKYDVEILNIYGIVLYMKEDYKSSIEQLALANTIFENNFDTIYNLACALESNGKLNEAKKYYLDAYNLTDNKEYKSSITEILKKLRYK